jgi:hypothetical protein
MPRPLSLAAACLLASLASTAVLRAGTEKSFTSVDPVITPPWNAELSTGWDSLYMFRGANQLPGYKGYGSSISWTSLSLTVNLTPADSLVLGSWAAFGLGESDYKEIDGTATYTHTIGNLSLSFGYALYAVLNQTNGLYAHELNTTAAYELTLGPVTLTPALQYAFNLGPAPGHRGYVEQCSSYLDLRLDANVPLVADRLALAPWVATGFNFRYNTSEKSDPPSPFVGANHVETGLSLPLTLSSAATLTPYVAGSYQWNQLAGTRPATFWGGVAVAFSF